LMAGFALLNRRFAYVGVPPLYVTEALGAVLLVLAPLSFAGRPGVALPRSVAGRVALGAVCLYLAVGSVRLLPDLLGSAAVLDVFRNFAVVYYAGFALLAYVAFADDPIRRIRLMFMVLVACSTAGNLVRVFGFFSGVAIEGPIGPYSKPISGHAVGFAILSACWLLGELQFRRPLTRVATLGISVLLALQLLFVYLSGHRSALLAMGMGFITFVMAPNGRRVLLFGVASLGIFVIAVTLVAPLRAAVLGIAVKYMSLFSGTLAEPNALWRYLFWQRVLDYWTQAPFTGGGFSIDLSSLVPLEFPDLMTRTDPHNSYLTVLARTGILGLVAVLTAIVSATGTMLQMARSWDATLPRAAAATVAACLAGYAVFAAMNVVLEGPYHGVPVWLLVGAAAALSGARYHPRTELQ
jgi:O-antigen ligase